MVTRTLDQQPTSRTPSPRPMAMEPLAHRHEPYRQEVAYEAVLDRPGWSMRAEDRAEAGWFDTRDIGPVSNQAER